LSVRQACMEICLADSQIWLSQASGQSSPATPWGKNILNCHDCHEFSEMCPSSSVNTLSPLNPALACDGGTTSNLYLRKVLTKKSTKDEENTDQYHANKWPLVIDMVKQGNVR
jgi:hypothetical protein